MIGTNLSHYKITAKLGEGGMGEVYRADDTQLDREVAIKVLPEEMAADPDRMARFEREAKVLASLNHPNIAAIYGLEQTEGRRALIMELVEGETLAEIIARGPIGNDQALPVAVQIAQALEAAHEIGIVHRDLKPANIKITPDGTVKVLDFGLAKATDPGSASGASGLSMSPTLTQDMTAAGIILGTASYMSPEQARGQPVDKRSDIWAFGSVLFEMLTAHKAFAGDTVTDILGAIVHKQPEWSELPETTPAVVRKVLHRCLENDPKQRLHDIADARIELQEAAGLSRPHEPVAEGAGAKRSRLTPAGLLIGALIGLAVGAGVGLLIGPGDTQPPQPSRKFSISIPTHINQVGLPVLSQQGDSLVFQGVTDRSRLFVRALDELEVRDIPGTDGVASFAVSPDGQWIAFQAEQKIKKVHVSSGSPIVLTDAPTGSPGVRWGPDDTLLFTRGWVNSGLWSVPAAGGEATELTDLDPDAGEVGHWWPETLPGEQRILFMVWTNGSSLNDSLIAAFDLETGEKRILFPGAEPDYLPSGHLLYYRGGSYFVAPFDIESLERTGPDVLVLPKAARRFPNGLNDYPISVSADGTLAYIPDTSMATISWFDRQGAQETWPIEPDRFGRIASAPGASRVAAAVIKEGAFEIWVLDPERRTHDRFTSNSMSSFYPVWRPGGEQIAFTALRNGTYDIFLQAERAEPEPLIATSLDEVAEAFTPDGEDLFFRQWDTSGNLDLWVMSMSAPENPELIAGGPGAQLYSRLSPDGTWVAYESDESGRAEIYVQPFPGPGPRTRVSTTGGSEPRWDPDGGEIFFLRGHTVVGVPYTASGDRFDVSVENDLFQIPSGYQDYDVSTDGRFVVSHPVEQADPEIRIVTNWAQQLSAVEP